jgi:hypothetical protein
MEGYGIWTTVTGASQLRLGHLEEWAIPLPIWKVL